MDLIFSTQDVGAILVQVSSLPPVQPKMSRSRTSRKVSPRSSGKPETTHIVNGLARIFGRIPWGYLAPGWPERAAEWRTGTPTSVTADQGIYADVSSPRPVAAALRSMIRSRRCGSVSRNSPGDCALQKGGSMGSAHRPESRIQAGAAAARE